MTKCIIDPLSSRACELGTRSCDVRHTTQDLLDEIDRLRKVIIDMKVKSWDFGDKESKDD